MNNDHFEWNGKVQDELLILIVPCNNKQFIDRHSGTFGALNFMGRKWGFAEVKRNIRRLARRYVKYKGDPSTREWRGGKPFSSVEIYMINRAFVDVKNKKEHEHIEIGDPPPTFESVAILMNRTPEEVEQKVLEIMDKRDYPYRGFRLEKRD